MEKKWIDIKTQASNQDSDHRKRKWINSLDETEVRFGLGSIDCFWSFEIAQKPIPYTAQTFSAL